MAERTETSALENKVALFSTQYTGALLAYHVTAAAPQKVTVALNSKVLLPDVAFFFF